MKERGAIGFSRWDLLVLLAAVVILIFFMLGRVRMVPRSARLGCVSNLKQVALAYRMWSNDQEDRFPFVVSTNEAGSREFIATGQVFPHFAALSNELVSPKVLRCFEDPERTCDNW